MAARIDPATFDRLATESTRVKLATLTVADLDLPSPLRRLGDFWGPGRFFAAQRTTSSTDPQERLLAITGRLEAQ